MDTRRGFTLVELLTVIGIIAVLGAILMPALVAAKKAVMETVSSRNTQQITQASFLYMGDSDQVCPPVFTHGQPVHGGTQWIIGADTLVAAYLPDARSWASPVDAAPRPQPDKDWFNDGEWAKRAAKRSYQFIGNVATREMGTYDPSTGMGVGFPTGFWDQPGRVFSTYEKPSETAFLVEGWRADIEYSYVGSVYYPAVWGCLTWLLPGRPAGMADFVSLLVPDVCAEEYASVKANPGYFNGKGLYVFADGRASTVPWGRAVAGQFELLRAVNKK